MNNLFLSRLALLLLLFGSCAPQTAVDNILKTPNLVALWDFREDQGQTRLAKGKSEFPLEEKNGRISRLEEGPLSGYSALFKDSVYLALPNNKTGALNIYGKKKEVTVMAWVKWSGNTGFVGGMWNEYAAGGKRQYGLFLSLPYYNGKDQVCGHISYTGKPTPPFPYSIDYSASQQTLIQEKWHCAAFTYDGTYIRSYLDGVFEEREEELIQHTQDFGEYPHGLIQTKNPYLFPDGMGNNGSDFTVGAVLLKAGMGNFFNGQIGGLAVFDRALSEGEIFRLSQ